MDIEPLDGYKAHMFGTTGVHVENAYLKQLEAEQAALIKWFEEEEKRFAALTPKEQHYENLMRARYGSSFSLSSNRIDSY